MLVNEISNFLRQKNAIGTLTLRNVDHSHAIAENYEDNQNMGKAFINNGWKFMGSGNIMMFRHDEK